MVSDNKPLNNPMANLARLYSAIEETLRRCNVPGNDPITMAQLVEVEDVKSSMVNPDQVRHVVKKMTDAGFVIKLGAFTNAKYKWNPNSGPFVLQTKTQQKASRSPSDVIITKPEPINKEIELVVEGVTIIVGKNPATGRIRLVIE